MQVNKNIYYRFEPSFDNGILYIYNYENKNIIKSDENTYNILKFIDDKKNKEEIIKHFINFYPDYKKQEIIDFIDKTICVLINNNVIMNS